MRLTDFKFTPDELCTLGCQTFVPISSDIGLRMEGLLALTFLGSTIAVLESLASWARSDPSRQVTPKTLNTRQGSCDKVTPNMISVSRLSASFILSRSIKFQWQSRSYSSSTRRMKTKSSEESWQSRAKLHGSAKAQCLNVQGGSRGSGGEASKTCELHTDNCMLEPVAGSRTI